MCFYGHLSLVTTSMVQIIKNIVFTFVLLVNVPYEHALLVYIGC